MQLKVRRIGNGYGVLLPRQAMERLRLEEGGLLNMIETDSGIELTPYDAHFSEQLEAFRRLEPKHRNSLRELAK